MNTPQRDWHSVDQVAEILGMSTKTVRQRILYGDLRAHRFGRLIRVKQSDLEKAMKPIKSVSDVLS